MKTEKITQKELALRLGTQQPGISRMVREGSFSVSTFARIIDAMGWTLEDWQTQIALSKLLEGAMEKNRSQKATTE